MFYLLKVIIVFALISIIFSEDKLKYLSVKLDVVNNVKIDERIIQVKIENTINMKKKGSQNEEISSNSSNEKEANNEDGSSQQSSNSENINKEDEAKILNWQSNLQYSSLIDLKSPHDLKLLLLATKQFVSTNHKDGESNKINKLTLYFSFKISSTHKDDMYKAFTYINELDSLTLENLEFNDSESQIILENVIAHLKLKEIYFSYGGKNTEGHDERLVRALAKGSGKVIEKISFDNTKLSSFLSELAAKALDFPELKYLTIISCELDGKAGVDIANFVSNSKTILSVIAFGNKFDNLSIQRLIESVVASKTLKTLDISLNTPKIELKNYRSFVDEFIKNGGSIKA